MEPRWLGSRVMVPTRQDEQKQAQVVGSSTQRHLTDPGIRNMSLGDLAGLEKLGISIPPHIQEWLDKYCSEGKLRNSWASKITQHHFVHSCDITSENEHPRILITLKYDAPADAQDKLRSSIPDLPIDDVTFETLLGNSSLEEVDFDSLFCSATRTGLGEHAPCGTSNPIQLGNDSRVRLLGSFHTMYLDRARQVTFSAPAFRSMCASLNKTQDEKSQPKSNPHVKDDDENIPISQSRSSETLKHEGTTIHVATAGVLMLARVCTRSNVCKHSIPTCRGEFTDSLDYAYTEPVELPTFKNVWTCELEALDLLAKSGIVFLGSFFYLQHDGTKVSVKLSKYENSNLACTVKNGFRHEYHDNAFCPHCNGPLSSTFNDQILFKQDSSKLLVKNGDSGCLVFFRINGKDFPIAIHSSHPHARPSELRAIKISNILEDLKCEVVNIGMM